MTADRISVSRERFLVMEPEKTRINLMTPNTKIKARYINLPQKIPSKPRIMGNLSLSCFTFPWTSPNKALCEPSTVLVVWAWLITSSICAQANPTSYKLIKVSQIGKWIMPTVQIKRCNQFSNVCIQCCPRKEKCYLRCYLNVSPHVWLLSKKYPCAGDQIL